MAEQVRVVDAVKTENVPPAGAQMPLKIDASGLNQALQKMVEQAAKTTTAQQSQAATRINPSVYMRDIVTEMEKLYARFDRLKKLAVEFHGLQTDTPIPAHVKIHNITIKFAITKNGATEECEADIQNVPAVGDLSNLLTAEFGVLISSLKDYSAQMTDIATKTTERCGNALQDWEKQNNRRVVSSADAAVVTAAAGEAQPEETAAAPVTLGRT